MGFVTLSGWNCKSICSNNILDDVLGSEIHRSFGRRIWQRWVRMCCYVVKNPLYHYHIYVPTQFLFLAPLEMSLFSSFLSIFYRQIILWSYFPLNFSFKGIPLVKNYSNWERCSLEKYIISKKLLHLLCTRHANIQRFLKLSNVKLGCKAVAFG